MNSPSSAAAPQPEPDRLPAVPGEVRQFQQPTARMVTSWLTPSNLDGALRIAEFMGKASLLPAHFNGNIGNCMLVLSQAARWGMDPFAVAQATAVVRGKLAFEGKLVAAALIATGAVPEGLDYEFTGEGQGMAITVTGIVGRTGKSKSYKGTVVQLRTDNGNWDKDPQSMLVYRATRQWARLYAPEVMLGVVTPDEVEPRDARDAQDVTVTGTEKPSVVPETKVPKKRIEKEASPVATTPPAETALGAVPTPAAPDPRVAVLIGLAETLMENFGNVAAAELRAINQQMGVLKLQNVPAVRLDEAIEKVKQAGKTLAGEA